ncbi:Rgg/GadR/MutR family transcriptional regulator [Lacticaseibacillus jixiensis]|uniref:Rgg/GadR/MutR family transcriptional regulator n=1 Tax=Lacticaseibacillus jixiensis TaxID=3231926 RepID=UPI0036F3EF2E
MECGQLVKQLREARRLSQAALCARGSSNRNTLASFERNGTRISFMLLSEYCETMNVSLEEFEFLLADADSLPEKRIVARMVSRSFKKPFEESVVKLLRDLFEETRDFFYYSLYAQYFLIKKYFSRQQRGDEVDRETRLEVAKIKDKVISYLDRIYPWGRFELVLYTNCMFLFSDENIRAEYDEAVTHMRIYLDSSNYSADLTKFLINGTQLLYEHHNLDNLRRFIGELREVAQIYGDSKARLVVKIFSVLQEDEAGKASGETNDQLIETLEFLGEEHWLKYVKRRLQSRTG